MPQTLVLVGLKQALPQQQPLNQTMANLQHLNRPDTPQRTQLSPPTQAQIKTTVEALPTVTSVSRGEGLRVALQQSGVFMEQQLVKTNAAQALPNDLKANLLRLLQSLKGETQQARTVSTGKTAETGSQTQAAAARPAMSAQVGLAGPKAGMATQAAVANNLPPAASQPMMLLNQLVAQVESAIARIELSQFSSMPKEDSPNQVLMADIPVKREEQTDVLKLRIEQEPSQGDSDKPVWAVTVGLNIEPLGSVQVTLTLVNDTLSTVFWAERESAVELIERRFPLLQQRFEEKGLHIGRILAKQGEPPVPALFEADGPMLDEKA